MKKSFLILGVVGSLCAIHAVNNAYAAATNQQALGIEPTDTVIEFKCPVGCRKEFVTQTDSASIIVQCVHKLTGTVCKDPKVIVLKSANANVDDLADVLPQTKKTSNVKRKSININGIDSQDIKNSKRLQEGDTNETEAVIVRFGCSEPCVLKREMNQDGQTRSWCENPDTGKRCRKPSFSVIHTGDGGEVEDMWNSDVSSRAGKIVSQIVKTVNTTAPQQTRMKVASGSGTIVKSMNCPEGCTLSGSVDGNGNVVLWCEDAYGNRCNGAPVEKKNTSQNAAFVADI